jgi:hypothetical protein
MSFLSFVFSLLDSTKHDSTLKAPGIEFSGGPAIAKTHKFKAVE